MLEWLFRRIDTLLPAHYCSQAADIPKAPKESLRILNWNILYGTHEGHTPLQAFKNWFSIVFRVHEARDLAHLRTLTTESDSISATLTQLSPDIIVINELPYDIPTPKWLERSLAEQGYTTFRGEAKHSSISWKKHRLPKTFFLHPLRTIARFLGHLPPSKKSEKPFKAGILIALRTSFDTGTLLPQSIGHHEVWTGASGGYLLRLKKHRFTLFGVHLGIGEPFRHKKQLKKLAELIRIERKAGFSPLVVGDFNSDPWTIGKRLTPLGLSVITDRSYPTHISAPFRALDQVWLDPFHFRPLAHHLIRTHSDHHLQLLDITPQ